MTSIVRVAVANGTQVNHGGRVHTEGEIFEVDEDTAAPWLAAGQVTEATTTRRPKKKT